MKNQPIVLSVLFSLLFAAVNSFAAEEISGKGQVRSVDPLYGRLTIKHDAIRGLAESGEHEYTVASPDLLKDLARRDLVDFKVKVDKSNQEITAIEKTGVAPPENDGLPVGQAVQGALESTAGAAQSLTSPIPPAHGFVAATTNATTEVTGSVLDDATTEVKKKF